MICLEDSKIICSDCVLFGNHKNHLFEKLPDFFNWTTIVLEQFEKHQIDSIQTKQEKLDILNSWIDEKKN